MTSSPPSFFIDGPCEDIGYLSIRDHLHNGSIKQLVEKLWVQFYPFADRHFREDARNHFLQRFWEMYLAVTLLDRGFALKRHGDDGPEFYVSERERRIWFEAIAPGPGIGPDQVPDLLASSEASTVPTEKILLRFTNALNEKKERYARAISKGIVSPNDHYVLAINSRGIPYAPYGNSMPYFIQAFLPFGPLVVSFDVETFTQTNSFYSYRPEVLKLNGAPVSTRAFLDQTASFCSAILHSSVDCANHPSKAGDDFSILHNPFAKRPIKQEMFSWCEQFILRDQNLHRLPPGQRTNGQLG